MFISYRNPFHQDREVAVLSDVQKLTQRVKENEEKEDYPPNKKTKIKK